MLSHVIKKSMETKSLSILFQKEEQKETGIDGASLRNLGCVVGTQLPAGQEPFEFKTVKRDKLSP
jgi:hypothetical protein